MKSKSPAFQFYAQDFLVGTAMLSAEETGAYIRLIMNQEPDLKGIFQTKQSVADNEI